MNWGGLPCCHPPKWGQTVHYCFPMSFFSQANNWGLLIDQESLVLHWHKRGYYFTQTRHLTFYHLPTISTWRTTKYCFYYTVLTDTNREKQDILLSTISTDNKILFLLHCINNTILFLLHCTNGLLTIYRKIHTTCLTCVTNFFLPTNSLLTINRETLFTIGHLTCILGEETTKNVKCVEQEKDYYMQRAEIERRTY